MARSRAARARRDARRSPRWRSRSRRRSASSRRERPAPPPVRWRQFAAVTAVVAMGAAVLPLLAASVDGRWHMPARGSPRPTSRCRASRATVQPRPVAGRVVGAPAERPRPPGRRRARRDQASDGLSFATTDDGGPAMTDRWGGPTTSGFAPVGAALDAAVGGNTSRLGRLLAPFAIRYVVIVEGQAPGQGTRSPGARRAAAGARGAARPRAGLGRQPRDHRVPQPLVGTDAPDVPSNVDTDVTTLPELARSDLAGQPTGVDGVRRTASPLG